MSDMLITPHQPMVHYKPVAPKEKLSTRVWNAVCAFFASLGDSMGITTKARITKAVRKLTKQINSSQRGHDPYSGLARTQLTTEYVYTSLLGEGHASREDALNVFLEEVQEIAGFESKAYIAAQVLHDRILKYHGIATEENPEGSASRRGRAPLMDDYVNPHLVALGLA